MRIRRTAPDDEPEILALLQSSLGWLTDEEHARFYRWKHLENPFGPSYGWVAVEDERIVGLRLFMRWEFRSAADVVRAVRAVDTATHPDYRGRGIFRQLTLHGLEELQQDGVAFVFNTPNDQSRPGYLAMGWQVVGRLPVRVRPRSISVLGRLLRARVPAELASLPTDVGGAAADILADPELCARLAASQCESRDRRLSTNRSASYLAWRYGHEPLAYRALAPSGRAHDGLVVFRLRHRGPTTEAVVADAFGRSPGASSGAVTRAMWRAGSDHFVALGGTPGLPAMLPMAGQGPLLTTRTLASPAPLGVHDWRLSMGDVELM